MILLIMLLKYFLEKHEIETELMRNTLLNVYNNLTLSVVNVRMNSTQLVAQKYN